LICRDCSRRCRCKHQGVIGVRTSRCLWHDTGGGTKGELFRILRPSFPRQVYGFLSTVAASGEGQRNAQRFGGSPQRTFALWRGTDRASVSSVADGATPYKYHGIWWEPPRIDVDQRCSGRSRGLQPIASTAGFCGRAYSRYRCRGSGRCRSRAFRERHADGAKWAHMLGLWGFNRTVSGSRGRHPRHGD
jgi:hypothetical protein